MRLRLTNGILAAAVAVSFLGGCHKTSKLTADAIEKSAAAIVQQNAKGTSTWIVGADGGVSALLKSPDDKPITGKVTGTVTFAPPEGSPTTVPATFDAKTGVLTATGPKLDADITPVNYDLQVDGQPWSGAIGVPRAGTVELVDTGKLQASIPDGKLGPNGGVVQMVGPDRVEIVANKTNGEVRAYVLDPDFHVVEPGDRKITIALEGPDPEVIVLAPQPKVKFVVGKVKTRVDPIHVTVAVNVHGTTHACLVGWHPGVVVVYGPTAPPPVRFYAVEAWDDDDDDHGHGHGHHGHGQVVVGGPGVVVTGPGIVVGGPSVVVGAPGIVVGGPGIVVGGGGGDVHVHADHGRHGH